MEKDVNLQGLTVWVTISSMGLIESIFFDSNINQNNYLHMPQTELSPGVKNQ